MNLKGDFLMDSVNKKNAELKRIRRKKIFRLVADIIELCFESDMTISDIKESLEISSDNIEKFAKLQDCDYFEKFSVEYNF